MGRTVKIFLNQFITILLLITFVGCNANISETRKSAATDALIRSTVAKCMQEEIDDLSQFDTEEDVIELLDIDGMTGNEIVSKALAEDGSSDYLDFCYATHETQLHEDTSYIMESAKNLIDTSSYREMQQRINNAENIIKTSAKSMAKSIPEDQQEAFYKDLKSLVVKTTIMLVTCFVYVAVPDTLIWGKVSAAMAIAVGAGIAASAVMDAYGYFKEGFTPSLLDLEEGESVSDLTFTEWISKLKNSSMATYAVATAALSYITSSGMSKITGAIIVGMFSLYQATDAIADMRKTYNFNA